MRPKVLRALICIFATFGSAASAKAQSVSDTTVVPLPSQTGAGADLRGPLAVAAPVDVCDRIFPARTGLPPDNPVANREDPANRSAAIEYAQEQQVRTMQALYCKPLIEPAIAARAKRALPAGCTLPPEPEAAMDPIHPLADMERSDVIVAEQNYLAAVARVEELRARCLEAATGTKRELRPVPSVSELGAAGY